MSSTLLTPFTAGDGENLALYEWPLDAWSSHSGDPSLPPRGVVLIVHGLGEHAMRYDHVANRLLAWGFVVRAYDQRGHGESSGARGALPSDTALLDDLAEVIDHTHSRYGMLPHCGSAGQPLPLILLGHSMGGLVVSRFVSLGIRPVEGLVLSSPALQTSLSRLQKLMLGALPAVAPNLCVGNGLNARFISRDERVVASYLADPLVHDRISPRLAAFIATAGPATLATAAQWRTPTLLMYAGADRLVQPSGSRAFAEGATGSTAVKPGTVTEKCFPDLYHEIFNELDSEPVFDTLQRWLDVRF